MYRGNILLNTVNTLFLHYKRYIQESVINSYNSFLQINNTQIHTDDKYLYLNNKCKMEEIQSIKNMFLHSNNIRNHMISKHLKNYIVGNQGALHHTNDNHWMTGKIHQHNVHK